LKNALFKTIKNLSAIVFCESVTMTFFINQKMLVTSYSHPDTLSITTSLGLLNTDQVMIFRLFLLRRSIISKRWKGTFPRCIPTL